MIEFIFEGGRSRSGKLLPPRYGCFRCSQRRIHMFPKRIDVHLFLFR